MRLSDNYIKLFAVNSILFASLLTGCASSPWKHSGDSWEHSTGAKIQLAGFSVEPKGSKLRVTLKDAPTRELLVWVGPSVEQVLKELDAEIDSHAQELADANSAGVGMKAATHKTFLRKSKSDEGGAEHHLTGFLVGTTGLEANHVALGYRIRSGTVIGFKDTRDSKDYGPTYEKFEKLISNL